MRRTEIMRRLAERRREKNETKSDSINGIDKEILRCACLGSAGINVLAGLTSLFGQFPMPGTPTVYGDQKMF